MVFEHILANFGAISSTYKHDARDGVTFVSRINFAVSENDEGY